MSWDVMLFKFQGEPPADAEGIDDKNMVPLGPAAAVRSVISAGLPGVDWSEPTWGDYNGPGFSIEFNTGDDDPIENIMLHVRGGGNAVPAIMAFAVPAGWSALDCSTGKFLDPVRPSDEGWREFQAYRDRVIERGDAEGDG